MKRKQILAFILSISVMLSVSQAVLAINADGISPIAYSYNSGDNTVTATARVNYPDSTLLLCSYNSSGLMTDMAMDNGTGQLSATLSKDAVMKAAILDENGNAITPNAVYGKDNTDLRYIKIDGKEIEGFKNSGDNANRYTVKVSDNKPVIEIVPRDAQTAIGFDSGALKVPGENIVTVTSAGGTVRRIKLNLYNDDDDPSYLLGISYKIDGDETELEGFKPYNTDYTVNLPDNTMSVKLDVKHFDNAKVTVRLKDDKDPTINSLTGQGSTAYYYERNCVNGFVPIKNGETQVKVILEYGQYIRKYNITFCAKQPSITDFNNVGAEDDSNKPVFIGGSAVNNDNGTLLGSDRMWTMTNISSSLLGGSMFLFPTGSNGNDSWWKSHSSGEYFNFTADTAGTVYVLSTSAISNSEYDENWDKGSSSVEEPDGGWLKCDKTWNDYEKDAVSINTIEYQVGSESDLVTYGHYVRTIYPGVSRISDDEFSETYSSVLMYPMRLSYYVKRHFAADEPVSVYHTGTSNAKKATAIIIWDGVKSADMYDEAGSMVKPDINTDSVLALNYDSSYTGDTTVWRDSSSYGNDLTLVKVGETGWVEGVGYKIGAGETVELPETVRDVINQNAFTVQFCLADMYPIANRTTNIILKSQDGNVSISKTRVNSVPSLLLKFGNNELAIPWENGMESGLYTVTFDKNADLLRCYKGENMALIGAADGATPFESFTADRILLGGSGSGSSQIYVTVKSLAVSGSVSLPNKFCFTAKTGGASASVMLLRQGKTASDVKTALASGNIADLKAAVMYFDQYESENGEAKVEIPMQSASQSGGESYTAIIDGEEKTVTYDEAAPSADLGVQWSGDSTNMEAVSGIEYLNLDTEGKDKALSYAKELISGTPTLNDAKDKIEMAVTIASITAGKQVGYSDLKELAEASGITPGVSFADADKLTQEEKEAAMTKLKGKAYSSVGAFKTELDRQFFTGIMKTEAYTDNEKALKLSQYAAGLGVSLDKYNKLSSDNKVLFIKNTLSKVSEFGNIADKLDNIEAPSQGSSGGGGGGGGGGVSLGTAGLSGGSVNADAPTAPKFNDLEGHGWAKTAIETLSNNNIISGYGDGSFKPQNTVTRAEFITMLARKYLSDAALGEAFSDVKADDWYYSYVMKAYSAGIVAGMDGGKFLPDREITRQDMAVMLYRLAKLLGKAEETGEASFTDFDAISDYAKAEVSYLKKLGVISGDDTGEFRPCDSATRAEAAQMIYNFIRIIG